MATTATYFLGNSIVQWTMVLSTMLFSMGVGSRLSKHIKAHLLERFVMIELCLSIVVALSAISVYSLSAYTHLEGVVIYSLSIIIGLLIGLEIPLATRINESYESLRVNISSVMENDYYGSLLGGVFFAFFAIPILGISYTPFVLGVVNFSVAALLFVMLRKSIDIKWFRKLAVGQVFTLLVLVAGLLSAKPIEQFGEQAKYIDKVIFEKQTRYQRIVITQWKDNYWLYINGNQQLSTIDEYLYHEPMVHSAMAVSGSARNVLILGGGDGCALREVLKYSSVQSIQLVDLDPEMTRIGRENPIFQKLNNNAFNDPRVKTLNDDALQFVEQSQDQYDLIIIDLPDPKGTELSQLYSREMYALCRKKLTKNGTLITQAGSPYFATKAYYCINKSMKAAGFHTLPLHNDVVTMGHWGWIMGHPHLNKSQIRDRIDHYQLDVETQWLNEDALKRLHLFGKALIDTADLKINTLNKPILHRYYLNGNWDLY